MCFDCGKNPVDIYCSCEQLFICSSCERFHDGPDHLLLKNPSIIFSDSIVSPFPQNSPQLECDLSEFLKFIEDKISQIQETASDHCKQIEKYYENYQSLPEPDDIITYTVDYNNDLVDLLTSSKPPLNFYTITGEKVIEHDVYQQFSAREVAELPYAITDAWIFHKDSFLYILGGTLKAAPHTKILGVNIRSDQYKEIGRLNSEKYSFGCTMHKNEIFIVGGRQTIKGELKYLNECQSFDVSTGKFTDLPEFPYERSYASAVVHDNFLYVVLQKEGNIYKLSLTHRTEFVKVLIKLPAQLNTCRMVSNGADIYVFNGDQIGRLNEAGRYEEVADTRDLRKSTEIEYLEPLTDRDFIYLFLEGSVIKYSKHDRTVSLESY